MNLIGDIHESQKARLIDLMTITPYLIYVSQKKVVTPLDQKILLAIGVFAVYYNASNYLKNKSKK